MRRRFYPAIVALFGVVIAAAMPARGDDAFYRVGLKDLKLSLRGTPARERARSTLLVL